MMKRVNGRAAFLLLILVLLIAPVANAWCGTVCVAAAISSGCAHGLQPTDDLPVAKAAPVAVVATPLAWVPAPAPERLLPPPAVALVQHVPLRI